MEIDRAILDQKPDERVIRPSDKRRSNAVVERPRDSGAR